MRAAPATPEDEVVALPAIAEALLDELSDARHRESPQTAELARRMAAGGWPWGSAVCAALGVAAGDQPRGFTGLDTWKHLPAWEDDPPPTPPRGTMRSTVPSRPDSSRPTAKRPNFKNGDFISGDFTSSDMA